jgi:hypothetical protein
MSDAEYDGFLDQVAAAHLRGEPIEKLFEMARVFLSRQPKGYAEGQRDALLLELKFVATQASVLEQMIRGTDDEEGLALLMRLFEKFRPFDAGSAQAAMAKAQEQAATANAKHRKARLARGLSAAAGTGTPGPRVPLFRVPEEPIKVALKGRRSEDITLDEYNAVKAVRDRRVLEQLPLGASRVGGLPDLPPGVAWPRHRGKRLPFIAQVELSGFSGAGGLLPPDGWLYAFGLLCDEDHSPPPVAVFTHRGPREALVRTREPKDNDIWPDGGGERVYEMVRVVPSPPKKSAAKRKADPDGDSDSESGRTAGWLLGEMSDAFGTPGEAADREFRDGDDWINLLAIGSVGSMQWSDCGDLYFLIRRSDLIKGDLSQVFATIESS